MSRAEEEFYVFSTIGTNEPGPQPLYEDFLTFFLIFVVDSLAEMTNSMLKTGLSLLLKPAPCSSSSTIQVKLYNDSNLEEL